MASTPRITDLEKTVFGNKVKTDFIQAPYTTIVNEQGNPREIPDLENNLKVSMGTERIMFNSIRELDKEFGPNGERVFELGSKDARVRFVGSWDNVSNNTGTRIQSSATAQDIEITFYGTGLNIMTAWGVGTSVDYSVDGGGTSSISFSGSSVLVGRNYSPNNLVPVVSGLSLGVHTVKISTTAINVDFYGCEILNENASAQLTVNAGEPFVGGFGATLDAQQIIDAGPSSYLGNKGARVVTYLTEEGEVGQAIQEVDATAQYLSSTDHSNEEIIRKINFREFGANRADDFSTLVGSISDRAFTLDDGTTTLVGDDILVQNDSLVHSNITDSWTLTFVGTGLAINRRDNADVVSSQNNGVIIDGTDVGNLSTNGGASERIEQICSGLPYGTHTVKVFMRDTAAYSLGVKDFIIYGPKKPALPDNTFELADYNIVADFVSASGDTAEVISTGVIRKANTREQVFINGTGGGTDWALDLAVQDIGGWQAATDRGVGEVSHTFYGTGVDIRLTGDTNGAIMDVLVDGVLLDTAGQTSLGVTVSFYGSDVNFDSVNGQFETVTPTRKYCGLVIEDLPLGKHKITVRRFSTGFVRFNAFDVITPIHINNTKVGSLSLKDCREDQQRVESGSSIDMTKAKAWFVYNTGTDEILSSYNISAILPITDHELMAFYFKKPFKHSPASMVSSSRAWNPYLVINGITGDQSTPVEKHGGRIQLANALTTSILYCVFFGELENEEDIDFDTL